MQATATATLPPIVRKTPRPIPVNITGNTVPDCSCTLVGIDSGTLFLRSETQIPESSPVSVSFDHIQLSGIVAACNSEEGSWIISVDLSSCRRRLDERIPAGEKSVLGVIEGDSTTTHPCTVTDTSAFGLGIRLSSPLEAGARVCVETASKMVFGEVRHCEPKIDGQYIAGILIVDVVPDLRTQTRLSIILNNLRWKLASSIRGRDFPASRPAH
jgi:hypothetical protein